MVVVDELVAERIHGWRPDAIRSAIQAHRPPAASSAADPSTPPAAAEPVAAAEGTDAIGDGAMVGDLAPFVAPFRCFV